MASLPPKNPEWFFFFGQPTENDLNVLFVQECVAYILNGYRIVGFC